MSLPKISYTHQIAIALVTACAAGLLLQDYAQYTEEYLQPFGNIFLNLLKFIVVPLVVLSIVSGMLGMEDMKKVGKLGVRSVGYFMLTTVAAVSLGLAFTTLLKPWLPVIDIHTTQRIEAPTITLMSQIESFFPKNVIEPLLTSSMMQVIVIAMFLGAAIVHVGDKGKAAREVMLSFNFVVTKILEYIMALAPIGIFCMLTPVVAVNGSQVFGSYAALIGIAYLCFTIHAFLIYSTLVWTLGKIKPWVFFRKMTPAMLFAYSSDSSVATLPYTMRCCEEMGVRKTIASFVTSLGATINMDGVAIYLGVVSVFMANCYGIDLSMHQYLAIALSSTVASIGTPGIPGGSLALMAMVLASAGIPVECVAIAAGIDRIVDMARTTMSITGDASCAVVLEQLERKGE